jgi:hypothetical protein
VAIAKHAGESGRGLDVVGSGRMGGALGLRAARREPFGRGLSGATREQPATVGVSPARTVGGVLWGPRSTRTANGRGVRPLGSGTRLEPSSANRPDLGWAYVVAAVGCQPRIGRLLFTAGWLALAHFCRTVPRIVGRVRAVSLDQHGAVNCRAECIFDGVQTETLPKSALPSSKPKLHLKRRINHSTSKLIREY